MRIESPKPLKNGGFLHAMAGHTVSLPQRQEPPSPSINAAAMMKDWFSETRREQYDLLGDSLGVSSDSLLLLKCAYAPEYRAWAFPMRSGSGVVVGIRLRAMDGKKWSVTGGREGIFLPVTETQRIAWCPEGPTNTAALLTLGKFAIGRPSCSGGIAHLSATVARLNIRSVAIVADNDTDKVRPNGDRWNPGLDGAKRLAEEIGAPCCIVMLPCKDAREFLGIGGTPELLDSLISDSVWQQPKNSTTHHSRAIHLYRAK